MQTWTKTLTVATIMMVAVAGVAQQETPESGPGIPEARSANVEPASSAAVASQPSFQTRYPRYKLRSGDVFDISFELSPEFNQSVSVQPDGYITLRGIGDVHVAEQTVPQLTETLRISYSKILNDPLISIVLKDFEKPYFIADGQIGHPGKYEMRGAMTLTEAIAIAGGFTDNAKHSQVLLFRRVNDDWVSAKIINVKKMEGKGDLHEDPALHPGDMLFVPKNRLSKIKPFLPSQSMGAIAKTY
jgi:protein involved in polysaccharide export with SLBB domain